MTREEFLNNYWVYYLMLEDRFVHTLTYVELSQDNEDVYSNEYAALIQMIGAEIDSFFKVCCGFNASDIKNITDYYHSITTNYPGILTQEVSVRAANMTFKPFDGWNGTQAKQSLFWWLAFDNIKHSRTANKKDASQKNALYALSALFLLEMKYLSDITAATQEPDIPSNPTKLFELNNWTYRYLSGSDMYYQLLNGNAVMGGGGADSV